MNTNYINFKKIFCRFNLTIGIIIFSLCILIVRLFYLQICKFKYYKNLSIKNRIKIIPIPPNRGIIFDRNGVVLAYNIPIYVLSIIPKYINNMEKTLKKLRVICPSITNKDIKIFIRSIKKYNISDPIPIKYNINIKEISSLYNHKYEFPGVLINTKIIRYYPLGEMAAHVIGYIGQYSTNNLGKLYYTKYNINTIIGKSGVEKFYDNKLRGIFGYEIIETDSLGNKIRTIKKYYPISGNTLYLTIDSRLQKFVYEAMKGKCGAVVIISTNCGEILAMVSVPSFNPNFSIGQIKNEKNKKFSILHENSMYNRATLGIYPPASTIKPFLGLIGLNKNLIDINHNIYDPGWFRLPGTKHIYHDWKKIGHGFINLKRAITVSCDTYFYKLGYKIGIYSIKNMLNKFGFGKITNIDLDAESIGLIPSKSWKKNIKHIPWYPGDTIITSIGQGFMLVSPLQLANATSIISQHGKKFRPHVLKEIIDHNKRIYKYHIIREHNVVLKNNLYWSIVTDAMKSVIDDREGTGYNFGYKEYSIAAKTGTAQVFNNYSYKKNYFNTPISLRDHSLFIAFAPAENAQISIVVLVENDFTAMDIAHTILDYYFKLQKKQKNF